MKFFIYALLLLAVCIPCVADTISQQNIFGEIQIFYFRPVGQSFTAIDTDLQNISLYVDAFNPWTFPKVPITVTLRQGDGLAGSVIASRNFTPDGFDFYGWYDVDFTGTPLIIGNLYTMEISSPNEYWGIAYGNQNPYSDGRIFYNESKCPTCLIYPNSDLSFRVTGSTPAIPEPSGAGILLVGLMLLWRSRRS